MGGKRKPVLGAVDEKFLVRAGLWVPARHAEVAGQDLNERKPLDFIRVAVGFRDLFGSEPTWELLEERLCRYSLTDVLNMLTKVAVVLERLEPGRSMEAQHRICDGLFGPLSPVRTALQKWTDQHCRDHPAAPTPALFSDLQVLTMAKVALLLLPPHDVARPPATDFVAFGEAMLMLNDLNPAFNEAALDGDPHTPNGWKRWVLHFLANGLFNRGSTDIHALPRAFDLYLSDKLHLRETPAYMSLPDLVRRSTGVDAEALWFFLFALTGHWRTIELDDLPSANVALSRREYFRNLNFSNDQVEALFGLACLPEGSMRAEIGKLYSRDALRPFHILPFAKWPLVAIEDSAFCPSLGMLKERLTNGLHHVFLNTESFSHDERDRFLEYMGVVFEDYVSRLLARAFPISTGRVIWPSQLQEAVPGKVCDFAVLYGDAVVLLEAKATRFGLGARAAEDWELLQRQFNDMFVDSAGQLLSTIQAIDAGRLRRFGVDERLVQHIFPVVVTLEEMPMTRVLYEVIYRDPAVASLLAHLKARALQVLDVGDLEFLEIALESGETLRGLLEEKVSSDDGRYESFGNFWLSLEKPFVKGPVNPFLAQLFDDLADRALGFFREHRIEAR